MKSKNVKVVDQNNIDRDANVMFAIDLQGSEYVVYWIERDDDENNIFVSKMIKDMDGTSNLLDIENPEEKKNVSDVVKTLIAKSVKDENDNLTSDTVTLEDGKVVKFVNVSFNKEQKMNVQKTYITTVQKEVTRVSEKYYGDVVVETPKVVEEVFPTVAPVVPEVKEEVLPEVVVPAVETPVEVVAPILSTPVVNVTTEAPVEQLTTVNPEPVMPVVEEKTVDQVNIVEPITVAAPANVEMPQPAPVVSEPIVQAPVEPVSAPVVAPVPEVVEPVVAMPTPVVPAAASTSVPDTATTTSVDVSQPLVFNASKETNLNAALGEAAKDTTIPVENIEPVREFGVEEPAVAELPQQPAIAPMVQPETSTEAKALVRKAGFANSKFFMVVAIAFFLASCVFLGYEVFNYFQLTK